MSIRRRTVLKGLAAAGLSVASPAIASAQVSAFYDGMLAVRTGPLVATAEKKPWMGSRMYLFVRGRQLEGTFPGSPYTGIYPITELRIMFGWGVPPEESWPYNGDASGWPPAEPQNIDTAAKLHRSPGHYQRVRTLADCKTVLAWGPAGQPGGTPTPVMVSFNITNQWKNAPGGKIPEISSTNALTSSHSVLLSGYDNAKQEFSFRNSWGAQWGDGGYGYISYTTFEVSWIEGWAVDVDIPQQEGPPSHEPREIAWAVPVYGGGVSHCRLFAVDDERIGWAFAIEREGVIEVEELFVKPQFRRRGFGTKLLDAFRELAVARGASLKGWVSFADMEPANLEIVKKLIKPLGFTLEQTDVRWAPYLVSRDEAHGPNAGHRSSSLPSRPRAPFSPQGL